MKQSLVLGHPDEDSVKQSLLQGEKADSGGYEYGGRAPLSAEPKSCVICHRAIETANAKTCGPSCALKRKTQLQRLRRWRGRR